MSLTPGSRIGRFEIGALLGAGSMGEVYRARDTRLHRDVAIKVLSAGSASQERLHRFEQEARASSALSHPNIITVFDAGSDDDITFLVTELLEGSTLRERLNRGACSLDETLAIAVQVASGLGAAHAAGIVHRDIKPENLFVTRRGTAKILDFGIARLLDTRESTLTAETMATNATSPGLLLGTIGYMAPEQIVGAPADARADIFALGCVMHEMAGGVHPFHRASLAETLSAIVSGEPRPLGDSVPPALARIILRSLHRDPAERFQSAHDLAFALSTLRQGGAEIPARPDRFPVSVAGRALVLGTVAMAAAAATWLMIGAGALPVPGDADARASSAGMRPRRAAIQVSGLGDIRSSSASLISLSADGSLLVYGTTVRATSGTLHVRRLDALDSRPIEGTLGAQGAFVSPDSRWVGFQREGGIFTVPLAGGAVTRVRDSAHLAEGRPAWTPSGQIVYTSPRGELIVVHADGSSPDTLTHPERGERHLSPHVLPDGRTVLFTAVAGDVNSARVVAVSLESRELRTLVGDGAMTPQFADGFLLYARPDRTLMAVPFDPVRVEISGNPVALPDRVSRTRFGVAHFAAGQGVLVYLPSARTRLVEVERSGRSEALLDEERGWHHPRYSPDGTRILLDVTSAAGSDRDVWIFDRTAKTLSRVTRLGDAHDPAWLPDGREVSFFSFNSMGGPLMIAPADGGSEPRAVPIEGGFAAIDLVNPGAWLPDGSAYVGGVRSHGAPGDIWRIPRRGGAAEKLVGSSYDEAAVAVSADGHWLAYQSDETGRVEIYVRALDGRAGRAQVSNRGGSEPVWHPRDPILYYVEAEGDRRHLVAATLRTSPTLSVVQRAIVVSDTRLDESDNHANYDIHPSGSRFVMPQLGADIGLVAVFDWAMSLGKRESHRGTR